MYKTTIKSSYKIYRSMWSLHTFLFFWSLSVYCIGSIKQDLFQLKLLCKDDEQRKKWWLASVKKKDQKQGNGINNDFC